MKNSADPSTSQVPGPAPGSFWGSLNPAEQRAFMSLALKRTFASGATLMQEGEPANHVIVILSGWTRITVSDGDRTRVIAERGPGQLVGERAALQVSVRSATVVALETVDGLVVRTSDFAGFVSAHPGVLAIVEGQVYERLTEESARLTPRSGREARQDLAGWGYGVAETHLAGPPAERSPLGQLQPFRGENCTVVLTDVVGFGARIRNDDDRLVIRKSLLEMTGAALGALTNGVYFEDRGDGILLIAPARIPTIDVLRPLLAELPGSLRRHNRTYGPCVQMQLRLSSDVGPVISDTLGVQGEAIIRTARLLEATALRKAMVRHRACLGVVVSPFVFDTAIGQPGGPIDSTGFAKIHVHVKETSQAAWMKLIDPASAEVGPVACLGSSRHRPETALPRVQRLPRLLGAREGSCPAHQARPENAR